MSNSELQALFQRQMLMVVAAGVVVSTALNVTPKTRFVLPTLPGDTFYNGVVELTVPIDFSLHNARF